MANYSVAAHSNATQLAKINNKLDSLVESRGSATPGSPRARRQASIQAAQWLNRLEVTEDLDGVWPMFETWLHQRPENLDRYLALMRTRIVIDGLRGWFPKEGSKAANQLLGQLAAQAAASHRSRRARWLFTTIGMAVGAIALVWATR